MSINLQYTNTTLNANKPFKKKSTKLFLDTSQMSELEATFNANVPFKNNCTNLFYHASQMTEFVVTLNSNVSSKSLKIEQNFSQGLEALKILTLSIFWTDQSKGERRRQAIQPLLKHQLMKYRTLNQSLTTTPGTPCPTLFDKCVRFFNVPC